MATPTARLERMALKEKYLDCLAAREASAKTLPEVIKRLLRLGVVRAALFRWAVENGHTPATVRSILSRAFCSLGLRQRETGAGRRPSAEALELLAHSRKRYGERHLRVLWAALRAGRKETTGKSNRGESGHKVGNITIVPVQLESTNSNCAGAIRVINVPGLRASRRARQCSRTTSGNN